MQLPPDVAARLAGLTPDQRVAATAPPGPVLCLAPAGSGKTTTLVARIAWLVATGTPADRIAAIAFNKRAADELVDRVDAALAPLEIGPGPSASARSTPSDARSCGLRVDRSSRWSTVRCCSAEWRPGRIRLSADGSIRRSLP